MTSLFYASMFAFAEHTMNRVLAMDELLVTDLRRHAGTVMALHSIRPQVDAFLIVQDGERPLRLAQHWEGEVDVRLTAAFSTLIQLMTSGQQSLSELPIEIEGDMSKAQALQKLLSASSIDWRYHFSKVLGDVPTQAISDTADTVREQARRSSESLLDNLDDFIHEEQRLLPGQAEADSAYARIAALRLQIDRLDARIVGLEQDSQDPPA